MSSLRSWTSLVTFLLYFFTFQWAYAGPTPYCKPTSSSSNWPPQSAWQDLNNTVSGKLFADVPPASVCHPENPLYNNATCALVLSQWTNTSFHASNPVSVDYNDEGCLPDARAPCLASAYPAYVMHAINASDVQAAVKFAADTGVRLIVKGTGHDLLGRSAGGESLSVWTHNIVGITVNTSDSRALKYGGVASMKIAAGSRMFEIYAAAAKYNLTVVGGGDMNVGIGGWITGAGHSPISSTYGLGADQILEMEVVTADGRFLTINENCYPNLFWAMRGGGGSTFGVLISVTVKLYPMLPGTLTIFSFNTTANTDSFWSAATYFSSQAPSLSEHGAQGYYYFLNGDPSGTPTPPEKSGIILGGFFFANRTPSQVSDIMDPIMTKMNTTNFGDKVFVGNQSIPVPDFNKFWMLNTPETAGSFERLGSRLLGNYSLTGNQTALKDALKAAGGGIWPVLNHLVAGPGVRNVKIPGGSNAVLPAWRSTYIHFVAVRAWGALNATSKAAETTELREVVVEKLREIEPHTGAYVNEADPSEPNFQTTFWGTNYPRLLSLKQYWDPKGVFWCKPCVGSELWNVTGSATQDGIGEDGGLICRVD